MKLKGSCKKKGDCLECKPPFYEHTFPGPIKCKQLREAWIKAVRREPFHKKGSWQPAPNDQVCSIHFVDGLVTDENSIPTLFHGYESKEKKSRRTLFRKSFEKKVREIDITSTSQEEEGPPQANFIDENLDINMEELNESMDVIHEPIKLYLETTHTAYQIILLLVMLVRTIVNLVKFLVSKINKLTLESKQLKHRSVVKTSTFALRNIKTD